MDQATIARKIGRLLEVLSDDKDGFTKEDGLFASKKIERALDRNNIKLEGGAKAAYAAMEPLVDAKFEKDVVEEIATNIAALTSAE